MDVAATPAVTGGPSRRAILVTGTTGLLSLAGLVPGGGATRVATAQTLATTHHPAAATSVGAAPDPVTRRETSAVRRHRRRKPIRSLRDAIHHPATIGPHAIMLTLDDGPHPVWTPRMLDLLERAGVTATFFMIGSQVHRHAAVAREVAARGHVIGNHTWSHDEQLGLRPVERIRSEIDRTSHAIHTACGVVPTQFRAPGGNWRPRLLDVLAERQLLPVGWDIDPADWSRPGTRAITRSLLHVKAHDIALCHDGGGDRSETYHALRRVIPALQQRGLNFVTLPADG